MEYNTSAAHIEERLAQLPEDVRAAVLSVEWEAKVQAIATRHKLHIDQAGALADTTLMAMLGFFPMTEYPTQIAQQVSLSPEEAATVAKEVSDEVFMSIRESMRSMTQPPSAPVAPAQPQAAAPAAAPLAPTTPKPDLSVVHAMLSDTVVSAPAATAPKAPPMPAPNAASTATPAASEPEAPKPQPYAADPYREPPL